MKLRLKPYREYRDSGVPWLGVLPSHWGTRRLKHLFSERDVRTRTGEERLLSLRMRDGLVDHLEAGGKPIAASALVGFKCVKPPEIVMNRMRAASGLFAVASRPGLVSPDYAIFQPKANVNPSYYVQLFKSPAMTKVFRMESKGLGTGESGFMRLYTDRFGIISAPLPPVDEQLVIVSFLNYFEQLVLRYVRAKMKVIALLNEQKQTVISRAVTQGLNPNMRLKPSGIDWLGNVPEHWEVAPLRRFSTKRCDGPFGSGLKSTHYTSGGVRVIRLQNIGQAEFKNKDAVYISSDYYALLGDHDVLKDDLLVAGLGDERIPAGRACVAPDDIEPAMVKADCFRFRLVKDKVNPQFIAFQLSSTAVRASAVLSTGATRQRINLQTTAGRAVAVPPLNEQADIVHHINSEMIPLDRVIQQSRREIDLLREFRTRLVTDIVTGKLDIRGVELPTIGGAVEAGIIDDGNGLEIEEAEDVEEVSYAED